MSLRTVGICASLMMLASQGAVLAAQPSAPMPLAASDRAAQITSPAPGSFSRTVPLRVQRDLASRLNVAPNSLQIIEVTPQTWPDQCLGLGRPNQRCMGGEVQGWQVQVASAQQMWTYRSDRFARHLKLEPLAAAPDFGTGDFSIETSQRLLQTVAQQVNRPVDSLEVLAVQPATWNGCLGIYEPDRACTAIAIAGFRALITDGQTVWVYHLNETAEQVAQNETASGAGDALMVSFAPVDTAPDSIDSQIVFQSQLSGDLAGSVHKTILTTDGQLYREHTSYLNGGRVVREDLKTLTPAEVQAFRQQLEQHRFANFNRLRYLTSAALADYPTTRLQTAYAAVDYIDLEAENLPPDLQAVIAAWDELAQ
ncbi:hypothetical protein [Nodosilinea nodulosa]|uniref:hypothetical protein n=1 Tax=Nodosilinea nodulosa TaxID=416001 RepID=UPI0002E4C024|nr:hypothetical protein [Nodosilinea nodulosa]